MYRVPFKSIARESGLSVRTLYRVMNNDTCVTDTTRRKAIRVLNKFGYTCLNQRRNKNILINVNHASSFKQPLALKLLNALSGECNAFLTDSKNNQNAFLDAVADASVLLVLTIMPESLIKKLRYVNPSCVIINILCGGGGDLAIDSNDFRGGKLVAGHLLSNGHRHVLVPLPTNNHPNHIDRMLAFKAEMEYRAPESQIDIAEYIPGQDTPESFWKTYFSSVKKLPTAVFCPLGGLGDHFPYYAEKFASLSVPDDISIVSYNRPEERGTQPLFQLDSIIFELDKIVDCCKNFALNLPLSGIDSTIHTLIEPQLAINGSVKNISNKR